MPRFLAFAAVLATAAAVPALAGSDRHVVLITLDGFPARYLDDPEVELPVIRGLRDAGASTARGMIVANPSVTWPNHTTLVTGVRPETHGVLFNGVLARAQGKPTTSNAETTQEELVRVPLLFDAVKAAGGTASAINWPCTSGSQSLADNFPDVRNMLDHTSPAVLEYMEKNDLDGKFKQGGGPRDEVWTDVAAHVIRERKPNLLALHLLELDGTHHQRGPESPQGRAVAGKLDALVGKVVQAVEEAGLKDKTAIFVTADHGFITVHKTLRPNVALRDAGLLTVKDGAIESSRVYVLPEGGIGLVYLTEPATREEDRATVHKLFDKAEGVTAVLDPADFPRYGLPDPKDHPGMADMVIAVGDGYGVGGSFKGKGLIQENSPPHGSHGYLSTEPKMNALFVAAGAGIKPGVKLPTIENVDVAPTIARILDVPLANPKPVGRVLSEILSESK